MRDLSQNYKKIIAYTKRWTNVSLMLVQAFNQHWFNIWRLLKSLFFWPTSHYTVQSNVLYAAEKKGFQFFLSSSDWLENAFIPTVKLTVFY